MIVSTLFFWGWLLVSEPSSICSAAPACLLDTYQVGFILLPTLLFAALVTDGWKAHPWRAYGALVVMLFGLVVLSRALHLSPYWGLYAGVSTPLLAALLSRTGCASEVVARLTVGAALLALLAWADRNLGDVDWGADAKPFFVAGLIYPFVAMEMTSVVHRWGARRPSAGTAPSA